MARTDVSEQAFFVLLALASGPLHGYAILGQVRELSEGRLSLAVGTLYGIVDRLAGEKLLEVDREVIVSSRLRRYYRLTSRGQTVLAREAERHAANARVAQRRLGAVRMGIAAGFAR